jgi:hypothetical protein
MQMVDLFLQLQKQQLKKLIILLISGIQHQMVLELLYKQVPLIATQEIELYMLYIVVKQVTQEKLLFQFQQDLDMFLLVGELLQQQHLVSVIFIYQQLM